MNLARQANSAPRCPRSHQVTLASIVCCVPVQRAHPNAAGEAIAVFAHGATLLTSLKEHLRRAAVQMLQRRQAFADDADEIARVLVSDNHAVIRARV